MALRLLPQDQNRKMPWKNGLGQTSEIEVHPAGATFPDGDLLWRLSSAEVAGAAPFSQFPGCRRWLMVISGQGLLLNGQALSPFTPFQFSGESLIECTPIHDSVVDVGLIYNQERIESEMSFHQLPDGAELKMNINGEFAYVFVISGRLQGGPQGAVAEPGDTFACDDHRMEFKARAPHTAFVLLQIHEV